MTEKVKPTCAPIIESLGYKLENVTFEQNLGIWELTLYISGKSPITHKDCERVSHAVDEAIERLDITDEPYHLSVSSVGVD